MRANSPKLIGVFLFSYVETGLEGGGGQLGSEHVSADVQERSKFGNGYTGPADFPEEARWSSSPNAMPSVQAVEYASSSFRLLPTVVCRRSLAEDSQR